MNPQVKVEAKSRPIERHTDAKFLNRVANDPSVYNWVRGPMEGELDLTPLVEDISNVLLMGEHGGMIFIHNAPGSYDIHTQVLPSGRGKWCLQFTKEALRWMFTRTLAVELTTRVPLGNLGALALVRANKMHEELKLAQGWVYEGKHIPATVFSLTVHDWIRNLGEHSPTVATGKWFLEHLAEEYARHGSTLGFGRLSVPDMANLGCAIEMILGGQKQKGVVFFNRWAKMVGIAPATIVTLNPLVIENSGALIKFRPDDFWVMSCP